MNKMHEGPRERLLQLGSSQLSTEELIAVILGTGTKGTNVKMLAAQLFSQAGNLERLSQMGMGELSKLPGMGASKACRLAAAMELGKRLVSQPIQRGEKLTSSEQVNAALYPHLAHKEIEEFWAIPVDSKNRILTQTCIAKGSLTSCPVQPSDIFRSLIREATSGVIFVHNHPSGDPNPSPEDISFTNRLYQSGKLLGIEVLDHLIITRNSYFSFLDEGILPIP